MDTPNISTLNIVYRVDYGCLSLHINAESFTNSSVGKKNFSFDDKGQCEKSPFVLTD
jgi:hypothetical protein